MNIHLIFDSGWGLGDLLAVDAALTAFSKKNGGSQVKFFADGYCGDLKFRPDLYVMDGTTTIPDSFDAVFRFRTYKNSDLTEYSKLESLASHLDHMASYLEIDRCGEVPSVWGVSGSVLKNESPGDLPLSDRGAGWKSGPTVAVCIDGNDLRRHYHFQNWVGLLKLIRRDHSDIRLIQVGHGRVVRRRGILKLVSRSSAEKEGVFDETYLTLSTHQTSKILSKCDYFLGSNSGLYQYAQALKVPSLVVFGMHEPERYTFFKSEQNVFIRNPYSLPCIGCSNRAFQTMLTEKCVAKEFARCMLDISPEYFYSRISGALAQLKIKYQS